jgi:hypothetical protein
MMETGLRLTLGERIMILRTRKGISKQELGAAVFPELNAANVKIKKIEVGFQTPTEEEVRQIAKALGVSEGMLIGIEPMTIDGMAVSNKIIEAVPALGNYIGIFNQLAALGKFDMMLDVLTSMCSDDNVRGKLEAFKTKAQLNPR